VKAEQKSKASSSLPLKPVAEELAFLRKSFKELLSTYATQIEADIAQLQIVVTAEVESRKKVAPGRVADVRDMLMLLRNFEIKPARGRRRDLKKVETLVADLREIVDRWG